MATDHEAQRGMFKLNELVFVPDEEFGYIPGEVSSEFKPGEEGKVRLTTRNNYEMTVSPKDSAEVERMDAQSYKDVDDMITLKLLSNPALLYNLRLRYTNEEKMKIYTNIGAILVAINPYKDMGLYSAEVEERYLNAGNMIEELPPHIFRVGEFAFQQMRLQDKDQSCVITGESGAGKTETMKRFLQYVSERSRRNKNATGDDFGIDTELLRQQIVDSNPFMEAFGNAKTMRNDNSSRFGKLIEMFFETGKGVVVGARITSYLLEKSRVVKVAKGERNYHIFYQLCAASVSTEPALRETLYLQGAEQFTYTMGENTKLGSLKIDGQHDSAILTETRAAMSKLGVSDQEIETVFRICAGILHLGNVDFDGEMKDLAKLKPDVQETSLLRAAELLGIIPDDLEFALLKRKLMSTDVKQHTVSEAIQARDALAKFIYEKMFEYLIVRMNDTMDQTSSSNRGKTAGMPRVLGVLDIFGFEHFDKNRWEQLLINYTNERLQQFFNLHVFKKEQAEYVAEGINMQAIGFYDNQGVVDSIDKAPKGIMIVTDDLCGLESAEDSTLLARILNNAKELSVKDTFGTYLFKPRIQDIRKKSHYATAFVVHHYAGLVVYNIEGFLELNKDQLRVDLRNCIADSKIPMLSQLFPEGADANPGKQGKYKNTLGTKFRLSLDRLMERLNLTTPQFVRTIKPNDEKVPGNFDAKKIQKQLREAGLLEVCRIRKLGYPIKKTHREFMNSYLCLDKSAKDVYDLCAKLAAKDILYGKPTPNWQIGKGKVFLRSEQAHELEQRRGEALKTIIGLIQRVARRFVFRYRTHQAMQALKMIREGMKKKNPEMVIEGLSFFTDRGPLFSQLPIVIKAKAMVKDFQVQMELIADLEEAMKNKDWDTIKARLALAAELGLNSNKVVLAAEELMEKHMLQKEVLNQLEDAIGSQDVNKLRKAIAYATQNGYGDDKKCKLAKDLVYTLTERERYFDNLKKAIDEGNTASIQEYVEKLRDIGCPDDHPMIIEAIRKGDILLNLERKNEQQRNMLEKMLKKHIKKQDVGKLRDLLQFAVEIHYTGELLTKAIEVIKGVDQKVELLDEVSNAARVLRDKARLPDGVKENDMIALGHALKTIESNPGITADEEIQVKEGRRLLKQMEEQIDVQKELKVVLDKENSQSYYPLLEKVQALGLQTRDADTLVQRVRELELLKSKSDAITNSQNFNRLKNELHVQSFPERRKLLHKRVQNMYDKKFIGQVSAVSKSRELGMRKYYKVRSDADFISRDSEKYKKSRVKLKHTYERGYPLTKSLLEMDTFQERKALIVNKEIYAFCDGLIGQGKGDAVSQMQTVCVYGICDEVLGDEIFIQLAKHLTSNPNQLSKTRAWYLFCLCATYFGPTERFAPYVINFLQSTISDPGLEGNLAKYVLAQISSSQNFNPRELKVMPGKEEVEAYLLRHPVLLQLTLVNGMKEDIPVPPDFSLGNIGSLIRARTDIILDLNQPEWCVYFRAVGKPPQQTFKQRLENFYSVYAPENLGNVDQLLAYYKGNEEALFQELTKTSSYGPEPDPKLVSGMKKARTAMKGSGASVRGSVKSMKLASSPLSSSPAPAADSPESEIDAMLRDDDEKTTRTTGSARSIASRISMVGSTISRVFRRARGLSVFNPKEVDLPNPKVAWPIPWQAYIGDVMKIIYERDMVPICTFRRRYLKTSGNPDNDLFLQIQKDFLESMLEPTNEADCPKYSAMLLCHKLVKANKKVPFGDPGEFLRLGIVKYIPRNLRLDKKNSKEWVDHYVEASADYSNRLRNVGAKELQKMFFDECVTFPTYGMSFFNGQVMKGNVKPYMAKLQAGSDSVVKIGVRQNELALFRGRHKVVSILLKDIPMYQCKGTYLSLKVNEYQKVSDDDDGNNKRKGLFSAAAGAVSLVKDLVGINSKKPADVLVLYTLTPNEIFDLLFFFKHFDDGKAPPEGKKKK